MGKCSVWYGFVFALALTTLGACKRGGTPLKNQRNQQESSGFTPGFSADDGGHGGGGASAASVPVDDSIDPADPDVVLPGDPGTIDPTEQITTVDPKENDHTPPAKIQGDGQEYYGPPGTGMYDGEGNYESYDDQKAEDEKTEEKPEEQPAEEPVAQTTEAEKTEGPSREELLAKADALAKKNFNNVFEDITRWEEGKAYAEMGIGGYKWFPNGASADARKGVDEDFPKLINFMVKEGYPESKLPKFLNYSEGGIAGMTTPSKVGFDLFKKTAKTGSARVDHTGEAKQVPTDFRALQNWLHEDDVRVWQMRYELSRQ